MSLLESNVLEYPGFGPGPDILLLHGLMGRGRTWFRHLPWLRELGRVIVYDASWHQGRDADGGSIATEHFVDEAAAVLEASADDPAVVIGHSMGGLHTWCLAAARPDLVRALVVEDMAPDFRGRTLGPWEPWLQSWPVEFPEAAAVDALVGPVAGQYFRESFDRIPGENGLPDGYRLHGRIDAWCAIGAQWGERDYWSEWEAVRAPALLIEAAQGITPQGQMREMAQRNPNAQHVAIDTGHLAHDTAPEEFRQAVAAFVRGLS